MHIEANHPMYSPSDLTVFMDSPFASWMEHQALTQPHLLELTDAPDPLLSVLQQKGTELEQRILAHFAAQQHQVVHIEKTTHALEETQNAMRAGVDIIYQAALSCPPFQGYADFLVKVPGSSLLGDFYYEAWDTKLSKTVKPQFLIQLCCYTDLLEQLQGTRPEHLVVVVGTEEVIRFNTANYFHYYHHLKQRFLHAHESVFLNSKPNPADSTHWGRWSHYAQTLLLEADDLGQVATITRSQIKKLHQAGIHTMEALVETPLPRIKGLSSASYAKLKSQAAIQKDSIGKPKPLYKILPHPVGEKVGLALLPPSSPLDIFFDIEGFPLEEGGLEYLWGATYFDEQGKRQYLDFWAHTQEQEKIAFSSFIDWAFQRWQHDPNLHIYHYANYEIAACRKLMGRYGLREAQVDALLRNEVFVDLYPIVKNSLLLGEPRYSIKNVEHLYRNTRNTEVGSGSDSVVVYERWRESPDGEIWETSPTLNAIRDYNIDDCNSTQELVDWLRAHQQEHQIDYLGNTSPVSAPEHDTLTERAQLCEQLLTHSNQLKAAGDETQAQVASLLAWSLEFHRREKKPMYWRLFDRLSASEEELLDDMDCLALCTRTNTPAYKLKPRDKNLCYEYRFDPNQEFKAAANKYLVLGQEHPDGNTLKVDLVKANSSLSEGVIVLKSGQPLENTLTLIPDEDIHPEPIPSAITRVASTFLQGQLHHTALHDFLCRKSPRLHAHRPSTPIAPSHDPTTRLTQIISAIKQLNNSYLTIQGPPGSGKTYTAKHVIAELLKEGKRIGISSNSHKAINHLLISTAQYCKKNNIPGYFSCTRNTEDTLEHLGITVYKNDSISASLQPACVIGTTAWGFARADLEQAFDYLFIDEAGQVSVANLIGMSQCAKSIVLMGDQMQLGQPSQGSHPQDSGLSILDYLLHTTPTIPDTMGIFLGTTYRMHSTINQFISAAIYADKLEPSPLNDKQRILVPQGDSGELNQEAGIIAIPVPHEGNTQASEEEVERIVQLAHALLGRTFVTKEGLERQITWDDMLFVAPYNHQVNQLQHALGEQAKTGSVDKFQGQEAPVVFLSLCASDANDSPRGLDFLLNKNRLNVAVSRALCMAIVVYSPALLDSRISCVKQLEQMNLLGWLVANKQGNPLCD